MTSLTPIRFEEIDLDKIAAAKGRVVVIVTPDGKMDQAARRANRLSKGAIMRFMESERFSKAKPGEVLTLEWPVGLAAEALDVLVLPRNASAVQARKAGAALGKLKGGKLVLVMAGSLKSAPNLALELALRD